MKSIISKIVMIAIILQVTQSRAASTVTVATDKSGFSAADVGAISFFRRLTLTLATEQKPSNTDGYEGTPVVDFVVAQTGATFPFEKGYLSLVLNDIRDMMYVPRLQAAYAFKNIVRIDQIESVELDEITKSILITGKAYDIIGLGYEDTYKVSYLLTAKFDKNRFLLPLIDVTTLKKTKIKSNN